MGFNGVLDPPRKAVAAAFLLLAPITGVQPPSAQVNPRAPEGTVSIDAPAGGTTVAMDLPTTISGWAARMSGPGTGIQRVDVYLDGPPGTSTHLGTAGYGIPRGDVAAAFGRPEWTNSGFALEWDPRSVAAGDHALRVVARGSDGTPISSFVEISVRDSYERNCTLAMPCYLWRDSRGWWIDTGGPAVRREPFNDAASR